MFRIEKKRPKKLYIYHFLITFAVLKINNYSKK